MPSYGGLQRTSSLRVVTICFPSGTVRFCSVSDFTPSDFTYVLNYRTYIFPVLGEERRDPGESAPSVVDIDQSVCMH